MKRIFFLLLISSFFVSIQAQDTIVFKDGNTILVSLVSMNKDTVKYKSWTNLKGPTWVKKQNDIARIGRAHAMPAMTSEPLDFCIGSTSRPQKGNSKCPSGNSIVRHIDSLYFYYYQDAETKIKHYVERLPKVVDRSSLYNYFINRYETSCKNGLSDDMIRDGEIYLYLSGEDEHTLNIVTVISKLYARQKDEASCNRWIDRFEHFSKENDDLFADDITGLKEAIQEMLHPTSLEEAYQGTWVLIEDDFDWAPYILRISYFPDSLGNNGDGATLIMPESSVEEIDEKTGLLSGGRSYSYLPDGQINTSQGIYVNPDYDTPLVSIRFASEKIIDFTSFAPVAHAMTDAFHDAAAKMIENINSSELSAGKRFGYSMAVTGVEGILTSSIALIASIVEKKQNQYMIMGSMPDKKKEIIYGNFTHFEATYTQDYSFISDYTNKNVQLVRWEPGDNVVFASNNKGRKKPITCVPIQSDDDPILAEFNSIKRQHTFWQPKYAIPEFVGTAAGLGMFGGGIACLTNGNTAAGVPLLLTGIVGSVATLVVPATVSKHRRNHAFEAMNKRGYDILRDKAGWTPPPVKEEKDVSVHEIRELKSYIKTDEALKAEYDQIIYRNRFGQAKYLVPFIGGTAATLTVVVLGGTLYKDTPGGTLLMLFGGYGMAASIIVPPIVCTHRKNKQLRELYHQHFDPKENAPEVGFSMLPCYTPENKGYGLAFNLTF